MERERGGWALRLFRFCRAAALGLFLLLVAAIGACAFAVTARSYATDSNIFLQTVLLEKTSLPAVLALTVAAVAVIALVHRLLGRLAKLRIGWLPLAVWAAAAMLWVWGVGCAQRADAQHLLDAARRFAQDDYAPLAQPYLQGVSYQLGFCLLLEAAFRLLPGADIATVNLAMQWVNALLSAGAAVMLAALGGLLVRDGKGAGVRRAAGALYLLFLPMLLFCVYVYGVLVMVFLCSGAFLCFAQYVRTRRACFGAAYALLIGLAAAVKPNAMIPLAALVICALMDALCKKDARVLGFAALAIALAVLCPRAVIAQYEWRSGIRMGRDVSMLARLAMGVQDSPIAPGWYNGYVDAYVGSIVPVTQQVEKAKIDLAAQLSLWGQEPMRALAYLRDKCLTQWLEPSHETLWYGNIVAKTGRFNGAGYLVYRDGNLANVWLLAYMSAFQRAIYALAAVGACATFRRRDDAAQLILPVVILGGFLYHMIFEAKAQYIYVYALYMIPLAAQGLCGLEDAVKTGLKGIREKG